MIRVGVIGIGFGQQAHVPAFRNNRHCVVEGICASTAERARRVAELQGIPRSYGDWRDAVTSPDLDAISIATPPGIQEEIALAAFAMNKPVFCEKPLATTLGRARALLHAARRSEMPHMVDFEFPEIAEWREARRIVHSGELGRIRHASVSWHVESYAVRMGLKTWKTSGGEMGGGVMNAFLPQVFHYVEWLIGDVERLTAKTFPSSPNKGDHAETAMIAGFEIQGGVSVAVSMSSHACGGTGHRVEVCGEKGSLVLDNPQTLGVARFNLWRGDGREMRLLTGSNGNAAVSDGRPVAVGRLIDRFVEWIRSGDRASPAFEEGVRVQQLLECARRSHAENRWIVIPQSAEVSSGERAMSNKGDGPAVPVGCRPVEA